MTEPQSNRVGRYLLGTDGPSVIITPRIAAWLDTKAKLNAMRIKVRGLDPDLDAALIALRIAAVSWRTSATGIEHAPEPEERPGLEWLGTTEAAGHLGMTDRGIRTAIAEQRLPATQVAGRWRINREDLEHFRATRTRRRRDPS